MAIALKQITQITSNLSGLKDTIFSSLEMSEITGTSHIPTTDEISSPLQ